MNYRDLCTGILFLGLGIMTVWQGTGYYADTAYIPVGVGVLMSLFSVGLIIRSLGRKTRVAAVRLVDHPAKFAGTLAASAIYFFFLPIAGFYTASTAFVVSLAILVGERRPKVIISVTIAFIALLYGLFALVLKRALPVEFFLTF